MGRELRMVPPGYEHRREGSRYQPAFYSCYETELENWLENRNEWKQSKKSEVHDCTFEEYEGCAPDPAFYMWYDNQPDESECTKFCMYECTSEGTPISPLFDTAEELADWLTKNNASAFAGSTATYDQWLAMIKKRWAPAALSM